MEGMRMEKVSLSDWEKLFAKCATDLDYRTRLTEALDESDDSVGRLLAEIGAHGTSSDDLYQRVSALRAARDPMLKVTHAFGSDRRMAVAP
jgi:hypothetical protein